MPSNSFIATAEAVSAVGATPRLVDVDPDSHLLTAEIVEAQPHPERALRDPGAPVRRHRRHGPDRRARPRGRGTRGRGRLPGARGLLPRQARRKRRRDGLLQLLPDQEPRRLGRRRRRRHLRAEARRARAAAARTRREAALPPSPDRRHRAHRRPPGGRAATQAARASTAGTKTAAGSGQMLRSALAGAGEGTSRAISPTALPFVGADHVYHLFVVRSEQRDELRDHLNRCDVASAVHYPEPIHLTDAYAPLGLAPGTPARVRAAVAGGSARCRCSRG